MEVSHLDSQETQPGPVLITGSETLSTMKKQTQRSVTAARGAHGSVPMGVALWGDGDPVHLEQRVYGITSALKGGLPLTGPFFSLLGSPAPP